MKNNLVSKLAGCAVGLTALAAPSESDAGIISFETKIYDGSGNTPVTQLMRDNSTQYTMKVIADTTDSDFSGVKFTDATWSIVKPSYINPVSANLPSASSDFFLGFNSFDVNSVGWSGTNYRGLATPWVDGANGRGELGSYKFTVATNAPLASGNFQTSGVFMTDIDNGNYSLSSENLSKSNDSFIVINPIKRQVGLRLPNPPVGTFRGSVAVSGSNGKYSSTVYNASGLGYTLGNIDIVGDYPTPLNDAPAIVLVDLTGNDGPINDVLDHLVAAPGSVSDFDVLRAGDPVFDNLNMIYGNVLPATSWDAAIRFNQLPDGIQYPGSLEFDWDLTGNDVKLDKIVVVPEPSAPLLLAAVGAGMLTRRKRR